MKAVRLATAFATLGVGLATMSGCKPPPPPPPMTVLVRVIDESKLPVHNAEIAADSRVLTSTNPEGRAQITVSGREGATYFIDVRCPEGYRSPNAPLEIRRLDNGASAPPEYVTRCSRMRHRLIVDIKTANAGGSVPIRYLGKQLTRTDSEGKARVVLEGDVLERIDLTLDTSDPAFAKIHPQSPVASFEIPNHDGETTFEVKFTADKPAPKKIFKASAPKGF